MRSILLRIIGVFEIAGGLFGLVACFHRLLPLGGTFDAIVALIGVVLSAFVLVAGVLLVEGDGRGVSLSIWAQLLQVPLIATPVFSYALTSGAFANIYMTVQHAPRLGFDWHIATHGWLLAFAGPAVSRIGVNLLAVVSWIVLRFGR
jgi:hypothetical protein